MLLPLMKDLLFPKISRECFRKFGIRIFQSAGVFCSIDYHLVFFRLLLLKNFIFILCNHDHGLSDNNSFEIIIENGPGTFNN